jgi:ZIP family zinc transporter
MSEPSSPDKASWGSWSDLEKSGGWMDIVFWSTLVGVSGLLLISGYSAFRITMFLDTALG